MPERARRRVCVALVAALLVTSAFYPFEPGFRGPYPTRNQVERLADGALAFGAPAVARTCGPPGWVAAALAEQSLALSLEARSAARGQRGPARIFTLSRDPYERNLTVAQDGDDLVIRLRRPGANADGCPPLVVKGVFEHAGWRAIDLVVGAQLVLAVDGETRVRRSFDGPPLAAWDADYRLALGDELTGDRGWRGTVRRAVVRVGERSFDCLAPGALEIPARTWIVPERARRLLEPDPGTPRRTFAWHVAIFVPFGWALVRASAGTRRRLLLVALVVVPFSAALELGKLFFAGRHPSLLHVLPDLLGALVGALLVRIPRPKPRRTSS